MSGCMWYNKKRRRISSERWCPSSSLDEEQLRAAKALNDFLSLLLLSGGGVENGQSRSALHGPGWGGKVHHSNFPVCPGLLQDKISLFLAVFILSTLIIYRISALLLFLINSTQAWNVSLLFCRNWILIVPARDFWKSYSVRLRYSTLNISVWAECALNLFPCWLSQWWYTFHVYSVSDEIHSAYAWLILNDGFEMVCDFPLCWACANISASLAEYAQKLVTRWLSIHEKAGSGSLPTCHGSATLHTCVALSISFFAFLSKISIRSIQPLCRRHEYKKDVYGSVSANQVSESTRAKIIKNDPQK